MNRLRALAMYEAAERHIRLTRADMLEDARRRGPRTFDRLTSSRFLEEYCWVVYSSGFRFARVEDRFPRIRLAFKRFDLHALQRTRSMKPILAVFNNVLKARSFMLGSRAIGAEGFRRFKARVRWQGVFALEMLPGIGPITKFHLAKNIGLLDTAKPDIWLVRAAKACRCSVDELVGYLSASNGVSRNVVDVVIWHYGASGLMPRARGSRRRG